VRDFTDEKGGEWQVVLGKESWGTLVLLFTPRHGGDSRTSILAAETALAASAELDALTDDQLRDRLRDSRPWP
jgi:hypothetical protein